ncbi:beta-ketoacyl-[acyl-carrier-protein] synthase family protein [Mesoterricola silvestris]|uniref:3-oxoacyl-ACP synthase n=1 Tax=Mesoterricola silvestris TaxID=2927979 RepID=A0AA48GW58_9BACT|nr:beta-ketoacyl-[acyl-carrier-protein] synthase family protein [Mesoterricola silvestris]BDU71443.1 3-oxoacyl-ACP synthase [Mesoterricola silvestris]
MIPVTGLGCVCGAGGTLAACMEALFGDGPGPAPATRFTSDLPAAYPVFEVPGFTCDPRFLRTSGLLLHATREALRDAGLAPEDLPRARTGVIIGTTVGCALNDEAFCRAYRAGGHPGLEPMERILRSNPAEALARELGLAGPCQTVVNACSSGTDAIGLGASWIRAGLCDIVLAGGADELSRITFNGFVSLKITSEEACRPFDRDRRGLNLGEGAALLVLEAPGTRRRARSFVLGYGSSCDAYHPTAPSPDGAGLRRAIAEAMGGLAQAEVAFVNAHGTATPDNDRVEALVLRDLLPGVPFLSTKGRTGHTLGAAGAIEAAFTAACLELGRIPPSAGFCTPDPALGGAEPVREATAFPGGVALSSSLAFGGNNAVLALGGPR